MSVVGHEWGVLGTPPAAFSHREGSMVIYGVQRVGLSNNNINNRT